MEISDSNGAATATASVLGTIFERRVQDVTIWDVVAARPTLYNSLQQFLSWAQTSRDRVANGGIATPAAAAAAVAVVDHVSWEVQQAWQTQECLPTGAERDACVLAAVEFLTVLAAAAEEAHVSATATAVEPPATQPTARRPMPKKEKTWK